jgi:broad specificity phosphatase PhoE
MRVVSLAGLLMFAVAANVSAQPAVFVVRHAERADAGMAAAKVAGADPDLSAAGAERARALAAMLKDAGIRAIFTTEYKRTRDTAEPLARALGIRVTTIASKDAAALIDKVKSAEGNVLVVGHSNTVPEVIKGLGVSENVTVGDDDYDNLFIVSRAPRPLLIRLHYGTR